jgi:hypothetical protein
MRRPLVLLTAAAVAVAAPSGSVAAKKHTNSTHGKSAHRAKVLRATLAPVREDVAAYTAMRGKAQMTANKRNAKVSLHLKGLVAKTTYTWTLATGTCDAATPLAGFKYKKLRSGGAGNANSKASSKKGAFKYDSGTTYSVLVYQAGTTTNEVLLCGEFKAKSKKAKKHTSHKKTSKGKRKSKP